MGRELRRKEAKKNKNKKINNDANLDTSIKGSTIAKIVIFSIIILLVLYYVVAVFITKELSVSGNKDSTTSSTSQTTNKILAKNTFNQVGENYYVYFYDFNDEDVSIASAISRKNDFEIYRVDTSSALNQNYVAETNGNRNVTSINDLEVISPTIIQVTNSEVTAYYQGVDEILNFLN